MARLAICRLHELSISFRSERGLQLGFGQVVDLDEMYDGAPLSEHLGAFVDKFDPVPEPESPLPPPAVKE